jgi:hypothetical protein
LEGGQGVCMPQCTRLNGQAGCRIWAEWETRYKRDPQLHVDCMRSDVGGTLRMGWFNPSAAFLPCAVCARGH